jgi:hypothetical protein
MPGGAQMLQVAWLEDAAQQACTDPGLACVQLEQSHCQIGFGLMTRQRLQAYTSRHHSSSAPQPRQ